MAKQKTPGDSRRVGAVKTRSQLKNKLTGTWTKRDEKSGKFLGVKADPKPFKGVRKSKSGAFFEVKVSKPAVRPTKATVKEIRKAVTDAKHKP